VDLSGEQSVVSSDRLPRKLAAILYADVVDYSRLTGKDEDATHRRLSECLDFIADSVEQQHGKVVHYAGDAVLAMFDAVVDALSCASIVQESIESRNADVPTERRLQFRIGVNLGDVIEDRGDIYGDGVNIAARLESLAQPGGICVSESVYDAVSNSLPFRYEFMGEQNVKNIEKPVRVYRVLSGAESSGDAASTGGVDRLEEQQIQFCTSSDGVGIAYASTGEGPTLVKAANWLNHLEFDWQSPIWRHVFSELSRDHELVRYDERGNGLSDWDVDDISFEAFVRDLEAVVDAAGLERFALLGISQGCPVCIAYAVRHPERVSQLVLYGGYAKGWAQRGQAEKEKGNAIVELIRQGWGQDNPAFRQMFTSTMIPGASSEQMDWHNDVQRNTTSPEIAARLRLAMGDIDVSSILPEVTTPTLVLHAREDAVAPFVGGRRIAAMIPGARFVPLESANHLLLENEPAWPRFLAEVRSFLDT
jgi:class 3 adenylate cyclase/pimeloyl-ACP methyl ester carboxylesterase